MSQTPIPLLGPEIYEGIEARGLAVDGFGWNSHHPIFAELIARTRPKIIVEVGTWKGASAIQMASLTRALGTRIFCVDTWIGGDGHIFREIGEGQPVMRDAHGWPGVYYQFLHNVKAAGFADRITPVPFMSLHAAWLLGAHGVKADLIYIDGGHHYLDVVVDISAYAELLAPGGVIFGDDFNQGGVRKAVEQHFETRKTTHGLIVADEKWAFVPAASNP
jgi:SAM-dependent methyltransferase